MGIFESYFSFQFCNDLIKIFRCPQESCIIHLPTIRPHDIPISTDMYKGLIVQLNRIFVVQKRQLKKGIKPPLHMTGAFVLEGYNTY